MAIPSAAFCDPEDQRKVQCQFSGTLCHAVPGPPGRASLRPYPKRQKQSKKGIATSKPDVDLIKQQYKEAKELPELDFQSHMVGEDFGDGTW